MLVPELELRVHEVSTVVLLREQRVVGAAHQPEILGCRCTAAREGHVVMMQFQKRTRTAAFAAATDE